MVFREDKWVLRRTDRRCGSPGWFLFGCGVNFSSSEREDWCGFWGEYDNPVPLGGSAFRQIRNFRNSAQNNSYAKMAYFGVSDPDSLNSIFIGVDIWNEMWLFRTRFCRSNRTLLQDIRLSWVESGVCVSVCAQSCPTLCDPMDCSPSGSSVHGVFQETILEWVAISSSRGSSRPKDWTCISLASCIGGRILYHRDTCEAPELLLSDEKMVS